MANKTIPQLPLQTGVTDLDLFAIVDSGETTTSSITRSEFMSGATDTTFQNIITNTGNIYANNTDINIYDSTQSFSHSVRIGGGTITNTSNVFGTTIGGRNNTNSGSNTHLFGGFVNKIQGEDNAIVTGRQNTIGSSAEFNSIIGGRSNTINLGCFYSTILGGQNNIISNGEQHASIIGGISNTTNGYRSVIVGGQSNTLNADNSSMIACSGRTGSNNYTTYVETLEAFDGIVMTDYAALNFTGDTAAAAGGVPLGGLYHDAGAMRIRIT